MRRNLQENFYRRLKELGGVKSSNNPISSLSNSTLIDYTRSNDGIALGIVKENHNYFIKTSNSQSQKLGAEDFAYIGGIENKFKYQYNSLAEAEKNRNFYIKTLNESTSKKFKKIAVNESENIGNAQSNADKLKADKAQDEANKNMHDDAHAKLAKKSKVADPASVKSAAAISVEKEADKAKVVDDTKESSAKPISVEKQAKAKVVKESFLPEVDEEPVADAPAEEPAADAPAEEPVADAPTEEPVADAPAEEPAGDEKNDLDAAADALENMGAAPEGGDEMGAEMDAEGGDEMGAAPEGGDEMDSEGGETPTENEGSVKDIEKLNGKITQKIRSTVLTNELTKGFLKSYIKAFDGKINDLEHSDRKELADLILKDDLDVTSDSDEAEIEEAINQHLAEMGVMNDEVVNDVKTFESYIAERGYSPDKVEEISLMEMVSMMNGYTNEYGDCSECQMDVDGMSNYATTDVMEKLQESGNSLLEDLMKPFGEKIKSNKKAYAVEAVIPTINEDEEFDFEIEDDKEEEEENVDLGTEKIDSVIAPIAEPMGIGTQMGNTQQKNVTVDLKNDTVNVTVNEAEEKLRKIIRTKLTERLNGKKPSVNEDKKSPLSIMIDELVNEAIQKRRLAIEKRLLGK